jgi:hypothetical protein
MRQYLPQSEQTKSVLAFVTIVTGLLGTFITLLYLGLQ